MRKFRYYKSFTVQGVDYEFAVDSASNILLSQPMPMMDEYGSLMSGSETTNENRGALMVIRKTLRYVADYIFNNRPSITHINAAGDEKKFDLYKRIAEKWRPRLAKAGYVLLIDRASLCIVKGQ